MCKIDDIDIETFLGIANQEVKFRNLNIKNEQKVRSTKGNPD